MRILGRSKQEETVEPDKSASTEKLRRGKGKKEEKKPWSKKERYFVLGVLGLTVFLSGFLALGARRWKLPGLPRLAPKISMEKTYIIEGDSYGRDFSEMKSAIDGKLKNLTGLYAIYYEGVRSGDSWGENDREVMTAASLIKLPVITLAYKLDEEGKINLDSTYVLKESDKIAGAGSLQYKPVGSKYSYRELLNFMGKQSDNTAFGIVRKFLGDEQIQNYVDEIGMKDTNLKENETSARDMGLVLVKLWKGELINTTDRDEMLDSLTDTAFENWIRAGIPTDVRVAHKYGREVHVVNDAGIILAEREPFVLIILSEGIVDSEADKVIPEISSVVWDFVK